MNLPSGDTPLYNHPLHDLEQWLREHGCERDSEVPHSWHCQQTDWSATLSLEETVLRVDYKYQDQTKTLSFPYSLTRDDVEQAVFAFEPPSST